MGFVISEGEDTCVCVVQCGVYVLHSSVLQRFVPISSILAFPYIKVIKNPLGESSLTLW